MSHLYSICVKFSRGGGMPPEPPSMNARAFGARWPPQSLPPTFALQPSTENHFETPVTEKKKIQFMN